MLRITGCMFTLHTTVPYFLSMTDIIITTQRHLSHDLQKDEEQLFSVQHRYG